MNYCSKKPTPGDAVLSVQTLPPMDAVILGGIEGVKRRLTGDADSGRIVALSDAMKYGREGIRLVFELVKNETDPLQWAAWDLLWENATESGKQKLLKYFPLRSEVGADYTKLRDLLARGNWHEADKETRRVMLSICSNENQGYLTAENYKNFPSTDLNTIDRLWVKCSGGRFGFSVQRSIWEKVCGDDNVDWNTICEFAKIVGWRSGKWLTEQELNFDRSAPQGHLPYDPISHYTVGVKGILRGGAVFVRIFGKCVLLRKDW